MPLRLAAEAASLWARTLKPMMAALKPSASVTSDSLMPPTPACRIRAVTSSVPSLSSDPRIASSEPCTSALMISGKSLRPEVLSCDIICSSEPRMPEMLAAAFSRFWWTVEAEHFDRHRRTGLVDGLALIRNQRADAAHLGTGHDNVTDLQR